MLGNCTVTSDLLAIFIRIPTGAALIPTTPIINTAKKVLEIAGLIPTGN